MATKKTTKKATAKAEQTEKPEAQPQPARFMECVDSHGRLMADVAAKVKARGADKPNHHDLAPFLERARKVVEKIKGPNGPLPILERSDPKHPNTKRLREMADEIETMFRNLPEPDKK